MTTPAARHPAVASILRFFEADHLPQGLIRREAERFARFAGDMADTYGPLNDPELTWALRQLLAAKDAAVRCAVLAERVARGWPAGTTIPNPSEFSDE